MRDQNPGRAATVKVADFSQSTRSVPSSFRADASVTAQYRLGIREYNMKTALRMMLGAIFFAVALLTSSWLLKGNPAGDWVEAFLYIGFACFLLSQVIFAMRGSQK